MSMACWPAADFTGQNVPVWFNGTWAWPNEKASATAVHYSNFTLTDEGRFLPGENVVAPAAPEYTKQDTYQTYYCDVVTATLSYMRVFLGPDGYLGYFGCQTTRRLTESASRSCGEGLGTRSSRGP